MKSLHKNILITFFAIIFCFLGLGVYYEEYQGLFTGLYTGQYSPGTQFFAWYFMGDIGTSYIYSYLYKFFPSIEWVSYIYTLLIGISSILIFELIDYLSKDRLSQRQIFIVKILSFGLFIPFNLMFFNFTRVSYLLCGASALSLIIKYQHQKTIVENFKNLYGIIFLYLLGSLTRVEPSMSISLLITCFAVVWNKNIIKGLKSSFVLLVIAYSILIGILLEIRFTDDFCKQAEPDIETSYLLEKVIPISQMTNAKDSMRYEAAMYMLWGDPKNISVDFLRSLTKVEDIWSYRKHRLHVTYDTIMNHWKIFHTTIFFNIVFCLFFAYRSRKNTYSTVLFILYSISIVILIAGQIFFVKLTLRAFYPILIIYTLSVLFLIFKSFENQKRIFSYISFFFFIIYLSLATFYYESVVKMKQYYTLNKEISDKVSDKAKNEILLLNAVTFGTYTNRFKPFETIHNKETHRLYINEAQLMPLINTYKDYLSSECNCDINDFSQFYKYLLGPEQNKLVYTLSDEKRLLLINKYFNTMYYMHIEYQLVKDVQLPMTYKMSMEEMYQPNLYLLTGIRYL